MTRARLTLRPGRATFLALLPEAAPALHETLVRDQLEPGQTASLLLELPDAVGDHVAKITVAKPDGIDADWYPAATVIPRGKKVRLPLPVALNDPSGYWVIHLRELYTRRENALLLSVSREYLAVLITC